MTEPFIGQIALFPYPFPPRGWAFCHGQLLAINQFEELYALIGTTYGGDGRTTFALPDLRGRVPVGVGKGGGLANYQLGQQGGTEGTNHPSDEHSHLIPQANKIGADISLTTPAGSVQSTKVDIPQASANRRSSDDKQPYLALNYCIALQGIFPARK